MNENTARRWAYAAAATGLIANGLFVAFYVGFTLQDFGDPHGVADALGSAADYAGIPQNALLGVLTVVVYRFLSPQRRIDRVLQVIGTLACATAVASGVLTVTGVTPDDAMILAVAAVAVSAAWLGFAIGLDPLSWAAIAVGCLGWLAIPVWILFVGRALARARDHRPVSQATLSPAA